MPHIDEPLLQAYIDGYCGTGRVAEIEAHLSDCAECRGRLEAARGAAQRASQLLGTLEPGPVHAPSFEELKERAHKQPADAQQVAAALEMARSATAEAAKPSPPFWQRSSLAWAATVMIAFAVGWFARSGINLPGDVRGPQSSIADSQAGRLRAAAPGQDEAFEQQAPAPGAASTAEAEPQTPPPADLRQQVAGAELDDAQAAKATGEVAAQAPPPEQPTGPVSEAGQRAQSEDAARRAATPPASADERLARENRALPPVEETVQVTGQSPVVDANEREGEAVNFYADRLVTDGFKQITIDEVELWLGAPPRRLSDLGLLRAEVGPGALLDNGLAGSVAVRLVYLARSGQEIELVQQFTGLAGQRLAQVGAQEAGRAAAAPARAERPVVADELLADPRAAADRDAALLERMDLPALVRAPDERVTYTWIDAGGYLLSISAQLDAETVRGLADLVR